MKKRLEELITFWKDIWGKFALFSIAGSIIALFIVSFVFDKNITLEVMNEWVSLVAGMSALVLSIISLFLSFYNVEQSNEVQKETLKIMNEVKEGLGSRIDNLQDEMNKGFNNIENREYKGFIKKIEPMIGKIDDTTWEEVKK
ncbi:hypothetical protein ACQRCQ_03085 [Lachnospiraceae bacterium SGI.085]|nr:hypothetical protein [Roseburia sp.]